MHRLRALALLVAACTACVSGAPGPGADGGDAAARHDDGGGTTVGSADAGIDDDGDAGTGDGDAGTGDGDAGTGDGDAGTGDAGAGDAGTGDAGTGDAGTGDAGDAGTSDAGGASLRGRYDALGPAAFTAHTLAVDEDYEVDVYLPATPGRRPVVTISPGLLQPRAGYVAYGARLASYGIVVIIRDDPGLFTTTPDVADELARVVLQWLPAQDADAASPLHERLDLTRVGVAGHSRGGKASLVAAQTGLAGAVDGWFGLDPVDSAALADGVQARDALPGMNIPTALLLAEVASSCSPAADSAAVLYEAAPSPSVLVTGVGAGHVQVQDEGACVGCGACTPAGTADHDVVLAYAVRYLTAFFARELLYDDDVGAAFAGAGAGADVAASAVNIASK